MHLRIELTLFCSLPIKQYVHLKCFGYFSLHYDKSIKDINASCEDDPIISLIMLDLKMQLPMT